MHVDLLGDREVGSDSTALPSKEWHFSEEWELFTLEKNDNYASPEPILNQEEIESLLSHFKTHQAQVANGVQVLLDSKHSKYEGIPYLDNIITRFVHEFLLNLRNLIPFNDRLFFSLQSKSLISLANYLDNTVTGVVNILRSDEWSSPILINLNPESTQSLLETLLGGRHKNHINQTKERTLTRIDTSLIHRFILSFLTELGNAFIQITKTKFSIETQNILPSIVNLRKATDIALLLNFSLHIGNSKAQIDLIIPSLFLDDYKEKLLTLRNNNKVPYSVVWENHLKQELEYTSLNLEAILSSFNLPLEEVLNWKVGTQINLKIKPSSLISIHCEHVEVMVGNLGQSNNSIAFQVKHNKFKLPKDEL